MDGATSYHGEAARVTMEGRKRATTPIDSGISTVQVKALISDPAP